MRRNPRCVTAYSEGCLPQAVPGAEPGSCLEYLHGRGLVGFCSANRRGRTPRQVLAHPTRHRGRARYRRSIDYLDRTKVTAYIALEPNVLMHEAIRARAKAAGLREEDGTLLILRAGAEDPEKIRALLAGAGRPQRVDTMLSIMTLCSIPDPQQTLQRLVREVLAPEGRLLFYEHVLSPLADVAWWQHFWTPIWALAFDGCCLNRPTHLWIDAMEDEGADGERMSMWNERELWGKEGEPDEHLFWHRVGRFVKHSN